MRFVLFLLFASAGIACIIAGKKLMARRKKYADGLRSFMEKCIRYDGVVLDVSDVPIDKEQNTIRAVIIQFRDEENHRTIVHRYTGSNGRKYYRGDKVIVYYCEESDSACIKNDDPFTRKARLCGFLGFMLYLAAFALFASGFASLLG